MIITDDGEHWGGEVGKGKFDCGRFESNCTRDDVKFEAIYAIQGELPKGEEIHSYAGFVLTGSRHSVNDNTEWMQRLETWVRSLHQLKEKPKMFGICFGHQFIAKALGGEVRTNPSKDFKFGGEVIHVTDEELRGKDFYKEVLGDRDHFKIMQSHGEEVSKLPDGCINVGTSHSCVNEVLSYGNHILTTQGHPELTEEKMIKLIKPRLLKSGKVSDQDMEVAVKSLVDVDTDVLVKFVIAYLFSTP